MTVREVLPRTSSGWRTPQSECQAKSPNMRYVLPDTYNHKASRAALLPHRRGKSCIPPRVLMLTPQPREASRYSSVGSPWPQRRITVNQRCRKSTRMTTVVPPERELILPRKLRVFTSGKSSFLVAPCPCVTLSWSGLLRSGEHQQSRATRLASLPR